MPELKAAIAKGGASLFFFALLWVWLLVSFTWSPQTNPKTMLAVLVYFPAFVLFAWAARGDHQTDKELILRAGVACVFVLAVLSAQEGFFNFPFYSAERGPIDDGAKLVSARHTLAGAGSTLAVLLWPVIAVLDRKGGRAYLAAPFLLGLAVVTAHYSHASSILLALGAGLVCYLAARAYPRVMIVIAGLTIVEILLAAPRLAHLVKNIPAPLKELLPPSYHHRLGIWQNAADLIDQKPWFGWGLDSSKTFTQPYNYPGVGASRLIPWHPHNQALHLWLETGLVGASLASALVLALTLWLARGLSHDNKATAGAIGALAAYCVFAGVSFGLWQAWYLASGFAAACLVAALVRAQRRV